MIYFLSIIFGLIQQSFQLVPYGASSIRPYSSANGTTTQYEFAFKTEI